MKFVNSLVVLLYKGTASDEAASADAVEMAVSLERVQERQRSSILKRECKA